PPGFANTGTPTGEEQSIQKQIIEALNLQGEAQKGINQNLVSDRQLFFTQLNTDMNKFLNTLETLLKEGETRDLKNQFISTKSKFEETATKRNRLANIQGRFGENAIVNAEAIKAASEQALKIDASIFGLNKTSSKISDIKS